MAKTAPNNQFRIKLNLLHPNEIPPSLPTRFLRWLISYGRYVVIFTEVIVVSAFVYRFTLDAELDRLKTEIKKDLPYIEGLVADEALIRQTQLKLQTVGKSYDNAANWKTIFGNITAEMPKSVYVTTLTLDGSNPEPTITMKIAGITPSVNDLSVFTRNLRAKTTEDNKKVFTDVNLDSLTFDKEELVFTITGKVVKK